MPTPSGVGPLSLRRNFSWTLAGNVVNAACQWGAIVLLTKLGSVEMVGRFALGLAIVTPIVLFSNLQLRMLLATDAKGEGKFGHYFALRLITVTLALVAIAAVALIAGYRSKVLCVILLVGVCRTVDAISDVFFGLFQQHERLDYVGISFMAKGPLSLLLLGVGVACSGSLLVGLVGLVLARVVTLVAIDSWNAAKFVSPNSSGRLRFGLSRSPRLGSLWPCWEGRVAASIAWRGLPLGLTMLLISLKASIPRFFIERYLGEESLGIFASLACFVVAGTTIVSALGQAAVPKLAKYYAEHNERAFRQLLAKMTGIFGAIGLLGVLVSAVGGRTILLVYGPEYAEHASFLVGLMVAAMFGFVASSFGYAATAARRIRGQPVGLTVVVLISLLASSLLIGPYGLWGAVATMIAASIAIMIAYRLLLPLRGCWV